MKTNKETVLKRLISAGYEMEELIAMKPSDLERLYKLEEELVDQLLPIREEWDKVKEAKVTFAECYAIAASVAAVLIVFIR